MAIVINDEQAISVTTGTAYLRAFYHADSSVATSVYPGFLISGVYHYFSTHDYGIWPNHPVDTMLTSGYFGFTISDLSPGTSYTAEPFVMYYSSGVATYVWGSDINWTTVDIVEPPSILDGYDYHSGLSLIQAIADAALGRGYVDAEGYFVYESKEHRKAA